MAPAAASSSSALLAAVLLFVAGLAAGNAQLATAERDGQEAFVSYRSIGQ